MCQSDDVVTDFAQGDVICRSCGLVQASRIVDEVPDFLDRELYGGSLSPYESVGISVSSYQPRLKSVGDSAIGVANAEADALVRTNAKLVSRATKRIADLMDKATDLCHRLGVSEKISMISVDLLERAIELDSMKARNRTAIAAAVVYKACRDSRAVRTLAEVAAQCADLKPKDVGRTYLAVEKLFKREQEACSTTVTKSEGGGAVDKDKREVGLHGGPQSPHTPQAERSSSSPQSPLTPKASHDAIAPEAVAVAASSSLSLSSSAASSSSAAAGKPNSTQPGLTAEQPQRPPVPSDLEPLGTVSRTVSADSDLELLPPSPSSPAAVAVDEVEAEAASKEAMDVKAPGGTEAGTVGAMAGGGAGGTGGSGAGSGKDQMDIDQGLDQGQGPVEGSTGKGKQRRGRARGMELVSADSSCTIPLDLIPRFASHLKLPILLMEAAQTIAKTLIQLELFTGRKPQLLSATALHLAHLFFVGPGLKVSTEEIADEATVSAKAIITMHKKVYPHWQQIALCLPECLRSHYSEDAIREILEP